MTLANKITWVRVALVPVFMVLFILSSGTTGVLMTAALVVFIIASISDFVDGHIARRYNQTSDLGKFLDPLADKLLVISAMTVLCQWNKFPAWALMVVLAREFAVSGLRMVASGKGTVIGAGFSGKLKTLVTMIGLSVWIGFIDSDWIGTVVSWAIVITTVYSGVEYFVNNRKFFSINRGDGCET